jgi:hypothetical protein
MLQKVSETNEPKQADEIGYVAVGPPRRNWDAFIGGRASDIKKYFP